MCFFLSAEMSVCLTEISILVDRMSDKVLANFTKSGLELSKKFARYVISGRYTSIQKMRVHVLKHQKKNNRPLIRNNHFDFWTPDWKFLSRTWSFFELPVPRTWSFSERFVNTDINQCYFKTCECSCFYCLAPGRRAGTCV